MQTITFEAAINENGNVHLPEQYQRLCGHQARFVVSPIEDHGLIPGLAGSMNGASEQLDRLLDRTRNIWNRGDGLAYQLSMREDWGRDSGERG
uniref:Uncharacterized protein n=1 Tax=Candidatus Kentrum sp. FW TaxID=2126338 RepID=A0A450SB82_9GAMM|nr:MAG: hypothetical protein BECKFW1821B_GA0114236_100539 [Candidatus Kentron sp. FW]